MEISKGRRRTYQLAHSDKALLDVFNVEEEKKRRHHWIGSLVRNYLLPQGYPASVAPQYAPYMTWRGVQYFFGGAIAVFTTRSLLGALGVGGRYKGEASAAINWALKDGAGRFGRFLFARWGHELDAELKQFRFFGDVLMLSGASLELSTILLPRAFLPMACTANIAKNLAAVANSSTRAPIYRTFALQHNLADVTAKGESVANLADLVGTAAGILVTKLHLPSLPTFALLALGYLVASRREVDSVVLRDLNRARLAYAARAFLTTGRVPSVDTGNAREALYPWGPCSSRRVLLGPHLSDAFDRPSQVAACLAVYQGSKYAVWWRGRQAFVLLHQDATAEDCRKGAFEAHVLLHLLDRIPSESPLPALAGRLFRREPETPRATARELEDALCSLEQECLPQQSANKETGPRVELLRAVHSRTA